MASSSVHDPKILDVLSAIAPVALEATVFRAVFQGRDPAIGTLAGGRWSPPQTFEALYTSLSAECAIAEVQFHLERQSIFPSRPVEVHTLGIITERTIDISTESARNALGIDSATLTSLNYEVCQNVGHAAEFLGFDSLQVPSARCDADNMVIIVGHLASPIVSSFKRIVDWTRYR